MSKIKNNLEKTNETMLNVLNQSIESKINTREGIVVVDNLYGLFLSNNTFVIAKEIIIEDEYSTTYKLENFFTKRFIEYAIVDHNEESYIPWEDENSFQVANGLEAVAFPIEKFLNKHIKRSITSKKNINVLFAAVNEYIKVNPTFVAELFKTKEKSKRI